MNVRERIIAFVSAQEEAVGADEVIEFFRKEGDTVPADRQQVLWTLSDCTRKGRLARVSRGLYKASDDPFVPEETQEIALSDARVEEAKRALSTLIGRKREDLEAIRADRDRYEELIKELERRIERSEPEEKALAAEIDRLESLQDNAQELFSAIAEALDGAVERRE